MVISRSMIYVYCEYLSYVSMNIEYLIELMDVFTPAYRSIDHQKS